MKGILPRKILKDGKGSVSIIAAFFLTTLICMGGFTVDLGLAFMKKRALQAATDTAALAAVQDPTNASSIASQLMTANGFPNAQIVSLTTGKYLPDTTLQPGSRFVAGSTNINAVRVTTSLNVPLSLAQSVIGVKSVTLQSTSTAAQLDEAGLTVGSGITSINNGLINSILGGLLNSSLSLNTASYQGLLNTNINTISLLNDLASRLNLTAGTYGQLLSTTVTVQTLLNATIDVLSSQGVLTSTQLSALQGLTALSAQVTGSTSISLGTLINAGIWSSAQVGSLNQSSALQTQINLFQMIGFAAQIANGSNLLSLSNLLSIPGIASIDVQMSGIEPSQTSYYSLGTVGTTVHTAQFRLLLTVKLLSALSLGLSSAPVTLPIYIEIGDGTATISGISCGTSPATDTLVNVTATPGLFNAYVGQVSASAMSNFSSPVTVTPAPLISVPGLLLVQGSAQIGLSGTPSMLTFNRTQITQMTSQTVATTGVTSAMLSSLSGLSLTITALGVLPITIPALNSALSLLLQPVFAGIDSLVAPLLATLGIRLGYLDVWVTGSRCGIANLVQ